MKIDFVVAKVPVRWLWGALWFKRLNRLYICPLPGLGIVFIFDEKHATLAEAKDDVPSLHCHSCGWRPTSPGALRDPRRARRGSIRTPVRRV